MQSIIYTWRYETRENGEKITRLFKKIKAYEQEFMWSIRSTLKPCFKMSSPSVE